MKKIACLILLTINLCGCSVLPHKNSAQVLFSSTPISTYSLIDAKPENNFLKNNKIHFAVYIENGFPSEQIRLQILKKNDKSQYLGYSIQYTKDFQIDIAKKYFINNFYIHNKGEYFVQIFTSKDKQIPISRSFLRVQ